MQQAAAANQAAVAAASAHQGQLQQPADAHRLLMQRQQANVQAQQQFNNIPPGVAGKNSIFIPVTMFQTPINYISI